MNYKSPLYAFEPQEIFLFVDILELIEHQLDREFAGKKIEEWFSLFESSLQRNVTYYVFDAYLHGLELEVAADNNIKPDIEMFWRNGLQQLSNQYYNVRPFGYCDIVCEFGNCQAFSAKMWYMGKIMHTTDFHRALAKKIVHQVEVDVRTEKKVLLLDLDNTLWGGLAGEYPVVPIILSDEKTGLAYKNFQRIIKQMERIGVLLCIVSKNNVADALRIIREHPHMVLKETDFSVMKINWENKRDNIVQIAEELHLGMESFVFLDDNPAERELILNTLPEVSVPDFPENPEQLPEFMVDIYRRYFEKSVVTDEDLRKTEAYKANKEREHLRIQSADFNAYLEGLCMKLIRVSPKNHMERFRQLMNKTNQFNLTTKRFSSHALEEIMQNDAIEIFLYKVTDKFGDNGIVAAAIVEYGHDARITEFTMSCRVMGRYIEHAIIEDMEYAARNRGFISLVGVYIPTDKNKPVENLYPSVGYQIRKTYDDGTIEFAINLEEKIHRDYCLKKEIKEDEYA